MFDARLCLEVFLEGECYACFYLFIIGIQSINYWMTQKRHVNVPESVNVRMGRAESLFAGPGEADSAM